MAPFNRRARRRAGSRACPPCLRSDVGALPDAIRSYVANDTTANATSCGLSVQYDVNGEAVVSGSREALRCHEHMVTRLKRLIARLTSCRVNAANATFEDRTPDEQSCAAHAIDAFGPAADVKADVDAVNQRVYCPCLIGSDGVCDDHNACTTDSCDPTSGCSNVAVADGTSCDDHDVCNGADTCRGGVCVSDPPLDCKGGNPCMRDTCDPKLGCLDDPVDNGTRCPSDGNPCRANYHCDRGACMGDPVTGAPCDDHNECTSSDVCMSGECVGTAVPNDPPTACEGGDACTTKLCHDGVCTAYACVENPVVCSHIDCDCYTAPSTCDPAVGCDIKPKPDFAPCGDGLGFCVGGKCCPGGECP
jgi:hypothetical protein